MGKERLVRRCILCGKEIEKGTICERCAKREGNKTEIKKGKIIEVCECGRYREEGGRWRYPEFIINTKKGEYIEMLIQELNEKGIEVEDIKRERCNSCSRQAGGYYEAIIQIRGQKVFIDKTIDRVEKEIMRSLEDNAFITNINFLKTGADIYIGSKKIAKRTAKKIKKEAKVKIKRTSSLYGVKDGKKIYRETILIKEEDGDE